MVKVFIIINQVLRAVRIKKAIVSIFLQIKIWIQVNDKLIYQLIPQICLPVASFLFLKICLLNPKKLKSVYNQKIKTLTHQVNNHYQKNCYLLLVVIAKYQIIKNLKIKRPCMWRLWTKSFNNFTNNKYRQFYKLI